MRPFAFVRRFPSAFTRLDRLFRFRDQTGAEQHGPSTRLGLTQLEDRIVLDAVGPGEYWDDGQWINGYKTEVTVALRNWGPGWLEVTGSGGAVSVSPGSDPTASGPGMGYGSGSGMGYGSGYGSGSGMGYGSGYGSGSGMGYGSGYGSGSGSGLGNAVYAFEVWGAIGDGSGDVTWSGEADNLYIQATGDVGAIAISGDLNINAGWTIGNLAGRDVAARAGRSIGSVTAGDDVWTLIAGTSIGTVNATDSIGEVRAGTNIGVVTAGGNVGTIAAGQNTASIQASGYILTVSAGWDVGGSVVAGTFIGGYENPTNDWTVWQYATFGSGVWAGRNIVGSVLAGGGLAAVWAGGEIQGEVRAGGDIWSVTAGGGYDPTVGSGYGSGMGSGSGSGMGSGSGSGAVQLTGQITGPVVAGRDILFIYSTGDVVGTITAGRSITAVNAGGSVLGSVTAALDVGRRGAADADPTWRPTNYDPYWYGWYGWYGYAPFGAGVQARDGSVAAVTATAGDVTLGIGWRVDPGNDSGRWRHRQCDRWDGSHRGCDGRAGY
ncbi:MAG: hypothetical protein LC104_12450 [Bacteroidales bacterium]|nr:hypothetical protein [Bacteroidales bacterium]